MGIITSVTKCAVKNLQAAKTTKCASLSFGKLKPQARLFSLKADPQVGTEITNNITGTRFFLPSSLNSRNISITQLPIRLNSDGSFSSLTKQAFDKLLCGIKNEPNSFNPVIKTKATIGKEVVINKYGYNRYFRPADGPSKNLITCIEQDGRYHSMQLKDFDDLIWSYI